MKRIFISLVAAIAALAQPALSPPRIGFVHGSDGSFRPVQGIAGCFLVGEAAATEVQSAASSGSFGLVKTQDTLAVFNAQGQLVSSTEVSAGPALFAFQKDGSPALVYLPGSGVLLQWTGSAFQPNVLPVDQRVTAIAVTAAGEAELLVERDDGLWDVRVSIATGETIAQAALPGVAAPALLPASGDLVYSGAGGIVIRREDGSEKSLPMPLPTRFTLGQMGDGWVHLRDLDSGRQFAIRLERDHEAVYELPEAGR